MKVLAFNGSPRKNANTETLIKAVLAGAESKGAETRIVNLHSLNMKGCMGCDACKTQLGKCAQKDDISPLLEEMADCDAIVLGSPVYWFHVSSQMKTLIDRFYCFFTWEPDPDTGEIKEIRGFPKGKKFVVVTSRGDEEDTKVLPEVYEHLQHWLTIVTGAMNASSTEFINHYGSYNLKDAAANDNDLMARATAAGEALV
jgi:multimeric flavodoxin WrbA